MGQPAAVAVPELGAGASTADAVRVAIATGTSRLLIHDPGVRIGTDAEDVHQARVAIRRLRSDLHTFGPVLDAQWTSKVRSELGWIAQLLGAVRDTDVLLARLRDQAAALAPEDESAASALLGRLEAQRRRARARLLRAMEARRYRVLVEVLIDASSVPPLAEVEPVLPCAAGCEGAPALVPDGGSVPLGRLPALDVVPALARRPWRRLLAAVRDLGADPPDEALHRVRVAAKGCRYAAEAATPLFGKPARRFAEAIAGLQGVLGDLNDAVVAEGWLRSEAARGPLAQAVVAGELIAVQRSAAASCRAAWPSAWERASAKRLRAWLEVR